MILLSRFNSSRAQRSCCFEFIKEMFRNMLSVPGFYGFGELFINFGRGCRLSRE
jgi:hypothetical protein